MSIVRINSLGITDGTIVNGDINASAGITLAKLSGVNDAKAWVNFDGTGTVSIRGSFNVTSITDNGTGNYTINFTNAITDANYCALSSGSITNDTNATSSSSPVTANNLSTSTVRIRTAGSSNTLFDFLNVFVAIFR